ncbi:MAG TPA: hypothetical protein VFN25_14735 [Dokdonella sp.]|uniref:hypothetical protein n=1 Tax=Dokdonella sp. TaxID=2291710 RepID=UPI002D7F6EF4|nr:hypothetical protein [Dokdonella sp.]HET9034147.1 hypothetical protein [Dokdonella sp.]
MKSFFGVRSPTGIFLDDYTLRMRVIDSLLVAASAGNHARRRDGKHCAKSSADALGAK